MLLLTDDCWASSATGISGRSLQGSSWICFWKSMREGCSRRKLRWWSGEGFKCLMHLLLLSFDYKTLLETISFARTVLQQCVRRTITSMRSNHWLMIVSDPRLKPWWSRNFSHLLGESFSYVAPSDSQPTVEVLQNWGFFEHREISGMTAWAMFD